MATYKTPGVYVEEISTLPPSVAQVSTAIPAFIGYTEKGSGLARINTLLEYKELFGRAQATDFTVSTSVDAGTGLKQVVGVQAKAEPKYLLYYCLSHYFKNGGGSCYIVSVGNYGSAAKARTDFEGGLAALEKEDEPTLIVLSDATNLPSPDYYSLCGQALAQCGKLKDRFAILDVPDGKVDDFRNQSMDPLMYGAAYHPYLRTTLNPHFEESGLEIQGLAAGSAPTWEKAFGDSGIRVRYTGAQGDTPQVKIVGANSGDEFKIVSGVLTVRNTSGKTGTDVVGSWDAWAAGNDAAGFELVVENGGGGNVPSTSNRNEDLELQSSPTATFTAASIKTSETSLFNQIKAAMAEQRVVLPPSAAMAGIYARVDRNRGVWKAPANVPVLSVIGPVSKINHGDQENLNVDPTAGKSINAIRQFTGKGILVWGARTLAGNDNEWRYVPVRRLFIMIEESTQKASAFAVFEPNDATTWLKVKGMIESYLYGLWEQGALAGSTPESAYFVNVGLGKTMTPQDILEGRLVVEIGIAAVRPAEFIIIRFSHKLQEA